MATIRGIAICDVTNTLTDFDGTEKIPVSSGESEPQVVLTEDLKDYINDGMQAELTFDTTPTEGSTNPVTSGGVESSISALETTLESLEETMEDDYAPLDSPGFIGTPTAPTPSSGDSSTQIATTAFVQEVAENMLEEESDPVFTASAAYGITSDDITTWNSAAILGDDDGTASEADFDAYSDTVWNVEQTLK